MEGFKIYTSLDVLATLETTNINHESAALLPFQIYDNRKHFIRFYMLKGLKEIFIVLQLLRPWAGESFQVFQVSKILD